MRVFVICLFILKVSFPAASQFLDTALGARQSSMGGAAVTISDKWGIVNNVGGLSRYESTSAAATYLNRFGLEELSSFAVAGTHHLKSIGTVGIVASRYGDILSEQRIGVGFSNRFGLVSLGISVNYLQLSIETLGKASAAVINFGGVAEIFPELKFGAHISNFSQSDLGGQDELSVPVVMKTGLSYEPSDEVLVSTEIEKMLEEDIIYKVGIEYFIHRSIALRTGLSTTPFIAAGGFGLRIKQLSLDYAYGNRDLVGSIHEISLGYVFFD